MTDICIVNVETEPGRWEQRQVTTDERRALLVDVEPARRWITQDGHLFIALKREDHST